MVDQAGADAEWDVFVSYSRSDAQKIAALVPALRTAGLRVFVDDTAVDDFASITATITEALSRSKVLLAVYSTEYPQRRACQWELTYAYLSGQHEGDPRRRALVINPERSADHVHPVELRDARHWPWPVTRTAIARLAERVAAHTEVITAPMGNVAHAPSVPWLPAPARTGSVAFTGRLAEQWLIHTALHRHRTPLVAQAGAGRTAQLRGMPGIGKTLLAQEYALHFSSSFPGGVFWFDLSFCEGSGPTEVMDAYADQVSTVLSALGLEARPETLPGLLSHLAVHLGERNTPCLWVVDGVPDGLAEEHLHLLRGPHLLSATLITTRSLRYPSFAEIIDVPPLDDSDGLHLLTSGRRPADGLERASATALVHDVGGLPQALNLLANLAPHSDFIHLRNQLHAPGPDILAGRHLPGSPKAQGSRTSTTALLSDPLTGHLPTDDILRLLALACPAPLTRSAIEDLLSTATSYAPWEVTSLASDAIEALLGSGALRPDPGLEQSWTIHPLLARAVRRHDKDTARQEDLRRTLLHALTPKSLNPSEGSERPSTTLRPPSAAPPLRSGSAAAAGTVEQAAAFDLQVELVTRVGVQPLAAEQGSLREALSSLHTLFVTIREVLHRMAGETAGPLTLPGLATTLANQLLRPFLTTWHPALQEYEAARPPGTGVAEHERQWKRSAEMRADLAALQTPLTSVAAELATVCGIDLLAAGPERLRAEDRP